MASHRKIRKPEKKAELPAQRAFKTKLKTGDTVVVVSGGNSQKSKELKGKVGKILKFLPKKDRVIVEGVNMITRHQRARGPEEPAGKIQKEGSIHISNVMYYDEKRSKAFRLKYSKLEDGRKVRGFVDPETKKFEAIEV